jgi:flagellar basal-body rod protein FlgG
MEAQQLNLNTIANNLANASTNGFKRSKIEFQDLLYQRPRTVGADAGGGNVLPTGIELGSGSKVVSTSKVFTQGQLKQTGEKMDIAIDGDGFLEVQRADGTKAYTRDGGLKIDGQGKVVTSDGLQVLSGFQPIATGNTGVTIANTGEVSVTSANGTQSFRIQLSRFANPGGLRSLGNNLYEETPASGSAETGNPAEAGFGGIQQGFIETSNVNIVEEMVNMIQAQRAYEINSKSIQTSDDMLEKANGIKR